MFALVTGASSNRVTLFAVGDYHYNLLLVSTKRKNWTGCRKFVAHMA